VTRPRPGTSRGQGPGAKLRKGPYLAVGVLVLTGATAYAIAGSIRLVVSISTGALLALVAQRYVAQNRASVAEIERTNEELRRSNADLRALYEFAAGLAVHTHDTRGLVTYARRSVQKLLGARVVVAVGDHPDEDSIPLVAAGRTVGSLRISGGDAERWARLREAIEPRLASALDSTIRVEQVRKNHLETIAALSRSMEAKDSFAGGHTERVSDLALGLARRLGYSGADLDAIEIGALMHDIGKVGIPEPILNKPGPLANDEWIVIKRHPVISELILSEVDLSPIVLQIARSSHERMDGQGYPDGLAGEEIPLPARIVLVADAFDALTSDRPYRRARRPRAAIEEIAANAGTQFCPRVVAVLERMYRDDPAALGEVTLSVIAG